MRLRALCLVGSCMLLAANAVAEDDADRLLARIDAQIVATNYTAAADLLGEFLRDHYDSEKVSDALMTGWHLAYRMDRGKDGRGLVIEARVWGAKMPRWPAPGIPVRLWYFRWGLPEYEGTLPFSFSKRPRDTRLYVVGRSAFTVADKRGVHADSAYSCAVNAYRELLDKHPGSKYATRAAQDLPMAYARTQRRDEAWEALSGLAKLDPTHEAATAEGMAFHRAVLKAECLMRQRADETNMPVAKAVAPFDVILSGKAGTNYLPRATYERGRVFEKCKDTANAEKDYTKVVESWPGAEIAAQSLARLGQLECRRGREAQKQKELDTGLFGGGGVSLTASQHFGKAAKYLARVPELHPEHELAGKCAVFGGQCWMRAEDYDKAVEAFAGVVEGADRYAPELIPEALYWWGDSLVKLEKYADAHEVFKRLVKEHPNTKWEKYGRARLAERWVVEFDGA